MPEKKDSAQAGGHQMAAAAAASTYPLDVRSLPTQESIDLLTRLLQDFDRRSRDNAGTSALPPDVERDVAIVNATFDAVRSALTLNPNPIAITSVTPGWGPSAGGTRTTITGSHFVPGATVRFGGKEADGVVVVNLSQIEATVPPGSYGTVDVTVASFAGSTTLARGFTYQS